MWLGVGLEGARSPPFCVRRALSAVLASHCCIHGCQCLPMPADRAIAAEAADHCEQLGAGTGAAWQHCPQL